ncbi:heat shock protein class I [Prevotella sp. CAG:1092]|jgi:HSP20 family protein|nr:heat shock protein class I [Prevotella sp. CAG:1092]
MLPVMSSNNWFPTMFDDFFNNDWMPKMKATAPAVNVKEDAKAYVMELAVPGIKKEYCRVCINNEGNLEVTIENKMEHKDEDKKEHYLRREFSYSNYQQVYVLPEDVEKDHVTAAVENGVLAITMPKKTKEEEKKALRQIEIG